MKTRKKEIVLAKPWTDEEEFKVLEEVVCSGWLSQGKKVSQFEQSLCSYLGAKHAVATTSGTTALHLSLVIAGIKDKDEVICPSFSFIASANVIEYVGARPVFVDIDDQTFNLDAEKIESKITSRTKGIVAVHQIGLACDMDKINRIARKYNLAVIEDAACALGATYKGYKIGQRSRYCCFSFHPRKIITTGEGGMIATDSKAVREKATSLRSHGASISAVEKHRSKGVLLESFSELGFNYRMTDLQAAVGLVQMKKLKQAIKSRQKLAKEYNRLLSDIDEVIIPFVPKNREHTFQSYLLRLKAKAGINADALVRFMAENNISCRRSIQPIHLEPYYLNKYGRVKLPVTEKMAASGIFLPIFPTLSLKEQEYIVDTLKKGISSVRKKSR